MNVRRLVIGLVVLLLAGVLVVSAQTPRLTTKFEVRFLEVGQVVGRTGLSIRVTLVTGQVVDYRVDAEEGRTFLQLAQPFLEGRSRLYAELDGNRIVALQVFGPTR